MKIFDRPIAFTDVETTGLDASRHEIIELGLVVIDQKTLSIIDALDLKIAPEHIETASPKALEINGYAPADWEGATSLDAAMRAYSDKTAEAMFSAHNITFDWAFISTAFTKTGTSNHMDYHRLDLLTMAWFALRNRGAEKLNLNAVAKFLGVPEEPLPHRAINGALLGYQVFCKLVKLEKYHP